jgi:hypothetical protein
MAQASANKKLKGWQFDPKGRPTTLHARLEAKRHRPQLKPVRVADVTPRLVPLIELRINDCRYPYDSEGGYLFCGLPKVEGRLPYCQAHCNLCYQPPDR